MGASGPAGMVPFGISSSGAARHLPQTVTNTLRLNYSNMPEDRIVEGIKRMAAAIREYPRD